jgi:membrane-associated PAP2 superfamily phosphatase
MHSDELLTSVWYRMQGCQYPAQHTVRPGTVVLTSVWHMHSDELLTSVWYRMQGRQYPAQHTVRPSTVVLIFTVCNMYHVCILQGEVRYQSEVREDHPMIMQTHNQLHHAMSGGDGLH